MTSPEILTPQETQYIFRALVGLVRVDGRFTEQGREFLAEVADQLQVDDKTVGATFLEAQSASEVAAAIGQGSNANFRQTLIGVLYAAAFLDKKFSANERKYIEEIARDLVVGSNYLERVEDFYSNIDWASVLKAAAVTSAAVVAAVILAHYAAPAIGGPIGAKVAGLHGAAASSKGLAMLGGGSKAAGGYGMSGGIKVLQAFAATYYGTVYRDVSKAYWGALRDFRVDAVQKGDSGSPVFLVNGFLVKDESSRVKWSGVLRDFEESTMFEVCWDSKNRERLGGWLGQVAGSAVPNPVQGLAASATSKASVMLGAVAAPGMLATAAKNPWTIASRNAKKCGIRLAEWLDSSGWNKDAILVGHSLGANAIFHALNALSPTAKVKDVYLLGGAVDRGDGWITAAEAVEGSIYNLFTAEDKVLKYLYRIGKVGKGDPVGLAPINGVEGICNIDLSDRIHGHHDYFKALEGLTF